MAHCHQYLGADDASELRTYWHRAAHRESEEVVDFAALSPLFLLTHAGAAILQPAPTSATLCVAATLAVLWASPAHCQTATGTSCHVCLFSQPGCAVPFQLGEVGQAVTSTGWPLFVNLTSQQSTNIASFKFGRCDEVRNDANDYSDNCRRVVIYDNDEAGEIHDLTYTNPSFPQPHGPHETTKYEQQCQELNSDLAQDSRALLLIEGNAKYGCTQQYTGSSFNSNFDVHADQDISLTGADST